MTGSRRDLTPVEYSSRIGGGRSARLIALGVCGVLGAFVLVGIAGREPAAVSVPAVSARPSAVAAVSPSPLPLERPAPRPAVASVGQIRPDESRPRPYQFLGTVLSIAGSGYIADLEEVEPGHYYAAYRIPFPRPARSATLELADVMMTRSHDTWTSLGRWDISLDPISPETRRSAKVLTAVQPPIVEGELTLLRGFEITVHAEGRLNYGLLTIDVRFSFERPFPNESYAVDARVGDFATRVQLTAIEPGHFSGVLVIPDRVTAERLTLDLVAMPAQNPLLGMVPVYEFTMELAPHTSFETGVGLSSSGGPQVIRPGTPELLTFGHEFIAQPAYSGFQRAVVLDLRLIGGVDPGRIDVSWHPRHSGLLNR